MGLYKNGIGRNYFVGRDKVGLASEFARRAHCINFAHLIRRAHR